MRIGRCEEEGGGEKKGSGEEMKEKRGKEGEKGMSRIKRGSMKKGTDGDGGEVKGEDDAGVRG